MTKYIAVDIGASSGRLMLSSLDEEGKMSLTEIHRFKNGFSETAGADRWQIQHLTTEILKGLAKVKAAGIEECYVGIDTWGVDYCLLDEAGELMEAPIAYRDKRTQEAMADFDEKMPLTELYQRTGIQLMNFNTVFQLLVEDKEKLAKASSLLLIPDYLGYVFTGNQVLEKTNASTMQLLNLTTRKIDSEILATLEVSEELFPPLVEPGSILGELQQARFPEYDLPKATFITIASHDTASAVVGTPGAGEDWAYISSGTWSLMGAELKDGIATPVAYDANFTNEWGVAGSIRFLKNIMGMWLIQEVARMQDYQYSYAELADMAAKEAPYQQFVNVNDDRFLNPANMIEEFQAYCRETGQKVPETPGEIARCVYDNLALCYAVELKNLQAITGRKINKLHIVGGGSNNRLLNQLTADACNVTVEAGPGEATAIGNLVVQMVATSGFGDLASARKAVRASFDLHTYEPSNPDAQTIVEAYETFLANQCQLARV
ncbi:rhamnulokinase [Enterococcus asini ATCC 700915]|uniref:Rhamnulokinase n=1 Tax=Enterococcus asini ATCC 700915 TaxID=1158606 RepID=R2PUW7_9ENTE|nr:rhamnulokinase [Enterococcus asini]EOH87058.1 rhamnulokinase [Enterococcus asini ATCC 700915]EOT58019.1 rhamnulokinase [Enterococcus asini ATCC 700915]OJG11372.1 rhamnulokinase [Enterococcus asini]